MKVIGETFSFIQKEKEPKRQDTINIQTFRQKDYYRTELWRALYKKAPRGQADICPDCGGKSEKAKEEKNKKGKY